MSRPSFRTAAVGFAVVSVSGVAGLAAVASGDSRELAFVTGLPAVRIASVLPAGEADCRTGIDVPVGFAGIRLVVATYGEPGPPLEIEVQDDARRTVLARGRVEAGYPDNSNVQTQVGQVAAGERVRVCIRNVGEEGRVALIGAPPDTEPGRLRESHRRAEPAVVFVRERPVSALSQVDEAFARAARFKAGWVGPWTFWTLAAAVAVLLPASLIVALRAAYASERSNGRSSASSSGDSPPPS